MKISETVQKSVLTENLFDFEVDFENVEPLKKSTDV
jgi:hypothetical protein